MALALSGSVLLVGAGKMGGALLAGWLSEGLDPKRIIIQDPALPADTAALATRHGIEVRDAAAPLAEAPAVIVVAVKPQIMADVFPKVAALAGPDTLVLSVAAGKTIASFRAHLPDGAGVVRCIPNTPASVGRGITVCCAGPRVTEAQRTLCQQLLSAVGEVGWVADEGLIDAATGISGSGPAYVFLLAECLAAAARDVGLDDELAKRLANATISGAGEMLRVSGLEPATLRQNVTSPNGTTAAALKILMGDSNGLERLMITAVRAAVARSRELSS
jgi:pyrroline-5-carboxylate reductase